MTSLRQRMEGRDPADGSLSEAINHTALSRFLSKCRDGEDGCVLWTGNPTPFGYGKFRVGGTGSATIPAHQFAYRWLVGPTESWQNLHHVCGVRLCVNDEHLLLTVNGEHRRQFHHKDECVNGHDLTVPSNVYAYRGQRLCRPCRRMNDRRRLGIPQERWIIQDDF